MMQQNLLERRTGHDRLLKYHGLQLQHKGFGSFLHTLPHIKGTMTVSYSFYNIMQRIPDLEF